jgi:hypothetical protein
MDTEATIEAYYDALRQSEPLPPFFATDALVKFGITERLTGYEEIEAGLREQTQTTDEWTVESHRLTVSERDEVAWFADDVRMAWRDTEADERRDHETRWSGTLSRKDDDWKFVSMHVSVPGEL